MWAEGSPKGSCSLQGARSWLQTGAQAVLQGSWRLHGGRSPTWPQRQLEGALTSPESPGCLANPSSTTPRPSRTRFCSQIPPVSWGICSTFHFLGYESKVALPERWPPRAAQVPGTGHPWTGNPGMGVPGQGVEGQPLEAKVWLWVSLVEGLSFHLHPRPRPPITGHPGWGHWQKPLCSPCGHWVGVDTAGQEGGTASVVE